METFSYSFPTLYSFLSSIISNKLDVQVFQLTEAQDLQLEDRFSHFHELIRTMPEHERKEAVVLFSLNWLAYLMTRIFNTESLEHNLIQPQRSQHVEKTLTWIELHFKQPFELAKIAEDLFLSPNYLSALFRKHTGKTITEYVGARRLQESCLFLHTPSLSIEEISNECGFADHSYFTRIFKKKYGQTPHQYRSNLTKIYSKPSK